MSRRLTSLASRAFRSPQRWLALLVLLVFSCLDPFDVAVMNGDSTIVIDGWVDTRTQVASVRLSHTKNLRDDKEARYETKATVRVIGEDGDTFALAEISPGIYELTGVTLSDGDKCSLHIVLSNGKEYQSDVVQMKYAPPIDTLRYDTDEAGVQILVSTHDASNNSIYYKWTSFETWEYTAANFSSLKRVNEQFMPRLPSEIVFRCWRDAPSPKITVANTLRLNQDLLADQPLIAIPKGSQKISVRYSVRVVQRVIEKAEYEYLTQLLKSTESLGGLFDPQPSPVYGNIRSVSGGQAIGYFSGGSSQEERIFIDWNNLPDVLRVSQSRIGCQPDTIPLALVGNIAPTDYIINVVNKGFVLYGYTRSIDDCSDCRRQGGVTTPPPYW